MLFSKIVGQSAVKQRLINSVKENRVSHCQLFLGPEGSGNLALAIAYAQYISCTNKQGNDACGSCSSCVKINKLVHPDIHFIFPVNATAKVKAEHAVSSMFMEEWRNALSENPYLNLNDWLEFIGIENKQGSIKEKESDEIVRKISLKPYESEYKIVIVWMAEKMNVTTSNKLLKMLEEPPEKTLFMLVASQSDQLLATIISRAQLIKINGIDETDMQKHFMGEHHLNEQDALDLARVVEGNYNLALKNINLNEEQVFFLENFKQWMRHCYKRGDFPGLVEWTDNFAGNNRERLKNFFRYALFIVRECMIRNYGSPSLQRLNKNEEAFVAKFHPFIFGVNAAEIMEELNRCYEHIERNGQAKIILLDATLKINRLVKRARDIVEKI